MEKMTTTKACPLVQAKNRYPRLSRMFKPFGTYLLGQVEPDGSFSIPAKPER